MRAHLLRQIVCLAVGLALVAACAGCWPRPRHGVIFRGDFALELNRIPWMKDRGVSYEECVTDPNAGCDQPTCAAGGYAAPGVCRNGGGMCPPGGQGGDAVAQAGYENEPRFFPVPTRPAFASREGEPGMTPPEGPRTLPHSLDFAPECVEPIHPRSRPVPPDPEPELMPAPPARLPSPKQSASSDRRVSAAPSWIFQPPADSTPDPSRTARGGWASIR